VQRGVASVKVHARGVEEDDGERAVKRGKGAVQGGGRGGTQSCPTRRKVTH